MKQLRRHQQRMQGGTEAVRADANTAAPSSAPFKETTGAAVPGVRPKRRSSSLEPAQAVSRDDCSGSASLTGEAALDEEEAAASRRSARTKRFRKSGDVDFAQILGRGGGSRALDVDASCDTHGSLGSAAESAPLERRASINSPHTLPPVFAAVGDLHRAGSTPASMYKTKPGGNRQRRGKKAAVAKAAAAEELGEVDDSEWTVLCAKVLTNSDANSGRIILPRIYVEANLSFVIGYRAYSLAASDAHGRNYDFVIKSWANGTEHRRVYVLEQAAPFIKSHRLVAGDAVGICTNGSGNLTILANTPEVHAATVRPQLGGMVALRALAVPATGKVQPLVTGAPAASCSRTPHCTKPDNHPGFCSRSKAAAADARHARDLGLEVPASSETGGSGGVPARHWRAADAERPTPEPPRRPRSERPTKPTLKIRAQQEAQADSLAAEVLMSLLGCSDSYAASDDQAAGGERPAVNSRLSTPAQQPDEKPPLMATTSTDIKASMAPSWQQVSQPPAPALSRPPPALSRPPPTQCITTGFSQKPSLPLLSLPSLGPSACRMGQPLPLFMPPPRILQTPLSL